MADKEIAKKPIISVNEARKLLASSGKNMTNDELKKLIDDTETVVRIAVRRFIGSKNSKNNDRISL
jgi:hypothetical protein